MLTSPPWSSATFSSPPQTFDPSVRSLRQVLHDLLPTYKKTHLLVVVAETLRLLSLTGTCISLAATMAPVNHSHFCPGEEKRKGGEREDSIYKKGPLLLLLLSPPSTSYCTVCATVCVWKSKGNIIEPVLVASSHGFRGSNPGHLYPLNHLASPRMELLNNNESSEDTGNLELEIIVTRGMWPLVTCGPVS